MKSTIFFAVFLLVGMFCSTRAQTHEVQSLKITVLSTMLAGDPPFKGIGEWGFSALVEVDGHRILFDTGERPGTVLENARELSIDLSDITDVVISHNHWDHVGGLVTLRREFSKKNPAALSRTHVAEGIFLSRPSSNNQTETNGLLAVRADYESSGGVFIVHAKPVEVLPGVWFTGPIPRAHQERNFDPTGKIKGTHGLIQDNIPEDAALAINTAEGLVVISGCGHAGIVNTIEYSRAIVRSTSTHAIIGGLHLFSANDSTLAWTATALRESGVRYLLSAHCTGIEASFRLRELADLTRQTAVVSAVGSSFTLGKGIDPLLLAR
jgi:7,8-dihydropterin-6-yl-methyl-4-(beta-D-ribofuranosyl)aminobenzene 5'-phosphate synthase